MPLFIIAVLFIVLLIIALAVFIVLGGMRKRGHIERALNMILLQVKVPREAIGRDEGTIQRVREQISIAEQMFSSFANLHSKGWNKFIYGEPYMSLEIAVQNALEDTYFYISVPRNNLDIIEKQIFSFYPNAEVLKITDYNIFHTQGASAGGYLTYGGNSILPIKSYQQLESDPLGSILTSFSKLQATGEGAALQILFRPSHATWQKDYSMKVAREMQSGRTIQEAMQRVKNPPKKDPNKPAEPEKAAVLTPTDEATIKSLANKASKQSFDINIRLMCSAPDQFRADQIFNDLQGAFVQYNSPDLNSLKIVKQSGNAFDKLAYNFAFRMFDNRQTIVVSTEELASLYHFPTPATAAPKVSFLRSKPSEPPPNLPSEGIIIGTNHFRGEERVIRMMDEDRRRHLYVIGQTGTGKTTLLKQLLRQDIEAGHGLCILDPAGDFADYVLSIIPKERTEDVIYFDPGDIDRPMGLNMLEIDPSDPKQKTLVVNELFGIFDKLYDLKSTGGPVFEKYFRNSAMLLLDDYEHDIPTLADISRVLTDDAYRKDKLSRETNPLVTQFWTQEAEKAGGEAALANMAPYISTKVDVFVSNEFLRPILNQKTTAFNFREIMDQQKILICNFSKGKIGDLNAQLLGLLIVGKLQMAAFSRIDIEEKDRKDFFLYMDEFQNFTTDSIATILSEARKFRLDLILAHQFIKQLPEKIRDAVFGNVGSIVALRVGPDDAEFLKNKFEPVFTPADLTNVDNLNAYVSMLIGGQTTRPFNIRVDIQYNGPQEMVMALKELSRLKYGRPREDVEAEIRAGFTKYLN